MRASCERRRIATRYSRGTALAARARTSPLPRRSSHRLRRARKGPGRRGDRLDLAHHREDLADEALLPGEDGAELRVVERGEVAATDPTNFQY